MCVGCHTMLTKEQKERKCVYLLQPKRSGTMQLFLHLIYSTPLYDECFHVLVVDDFDSEVSICVYMYYIIYILFVHLGYCTTSTVSSRIYYCKISWSPNYIRP